MSSGRPRQKYTPIKMPTQLCMIINVRIECAKMLKGVCKDVKGWLQHKDVDALCHTYMNDTSYLTVKYLEVDPGGV